MKNEYFGSQLKSLADKAGINSLLPFLGGNLKVSLSFTPAVLELSISELCLGVRSENGLRRANIHTLQDLKKRLETPDGLSSIRNLGRKSVSEIKTKLLLFCYATLPEEERLRFWIYIAENNVLPYAITAHCS